MVEKSGKWRWKRKIDEANEGELAENNGDDEAGDVDGKNGPFGETGVGIENQRDGEQSGEKCGEASKKEICVTGIKMDFDGEPDETWNDDEF